MLRSMRDLEGFTLAAIDGNIGDVNDFYFDNEAWVIRYLVVETGSWLFGGQVLISPFSTELPDWASRRLPIHVDKQEVRNIIDSEPERRAVATALNQPAAESWAIGPPTQQDTDDQSLRSGRALLGFHINATDGGIGHVEDVLIDEDTWAIQYFVVNTSNWWHGHKVLIAPEWIVDVSWEDRIVAVDLEQAAVRESPHYESTQQLYREREEALYGHYGRVVYWRVEAVIAQVG
ncbi:PRC-barrel domain-containing protein [Pseudomonas sp. W2-17]|uniref:PRC-barrel domain-containing protein n=1 Tax=Pseudomonas sp. W2-17 TaxID=3058039 RepID=UPI0034E0D7F1